MPRPTTKQELLAAVDKEWAALEAQLAPLTQEQMTSAGVVGEWSVKDVLAHLAEWHSMCLGWYQAGLRSEIPSLPAPGFKWNQTPELNQQIYEKYRDQPLNEVRDWLQATHAETRGVIQSLSDEELFGPSPYTWTGKNTLGAYFVSATSSHYLWARKEIRKGLGSEAAAV